MWVQLRPDRPRSQQKNRAPFTVAGLAKLIARAGDAAKIGFKVHAHMLRHACGYALANRGTDTRTLQAYLGHRSIQSTVRYTELAPGGRSGLSRHGRNATSVPACSDLFI